MCLPVQIINSRLDMARRMDITISYVTRNQLDSDYLRPKIKQPKIVKFLVSPRYSHINLYESNRALNLCLLLGLPTFYVFRFPGYISMYFDNIEIIIMMSQYKHKSLLEDPSKNCLFLKICYPI